MFVLINIVYIYEKDKVQIYSYIYVYVYKDTDTLAGIQNIPFQAHDVTSKYIFLQQLANENVYVGSCILCFGTWGTTTVQHVRNPKEVNATS